jgi:glycerol-3-phosphate cytidylyltransferase
VRKGILFGVFDLLHYGHILAFRECRAKCDHLTIGLNSANNIDAQVNPGKNKPVFSLKERMELLKECRLIDDVVVYNSENELLTLLQNGKYTVRFLGDDYRDKLITGGELTKEIYYLDRSHGISSSAIRKRIASATYK